MLSLSCPDFHECGYTQEISYEDVDSSAFLRRQTVYELFDTEQNYVNDLRIIKFKVMDPCVSQQLLSPLEATSVFSSLDDIILVHQEFVRKLEQRHDLNRFKRIADIFLSIHPYLKVYSEYCRNYAGALINLETLQRMNPLFQTFLQKSEQKYKFDLSSLLLKPVQRICKYPLFLERLQKHTSSRHPEHQELRFASSLILKILNDVNESSKKKSFWRRK